MEVNEQDFLQVFEDSGIERRKWLNKTSYKYFKLAE